MYIDSVVYNDEFMSWVRDHDNQLYFIKEPMEYVCYKRNDNANYVSLFGDHLEKHTFTSYNDFNDFTRNNSELFESDIKPIHQALSTMFHDVEDTMWNVGFFDIEVDFDLSDGRGYPDASNPFGVINSFQLYDVRRNEYHMIMLTKDNPVTIIDEVDGLPVICHNCVTERQLLDTMFDVIEDIDVLSGWYSQQFDIPYIIERMKLLYPSSYKKLLCRDGFSLRSNDAVDDYANPYTHYTLVGRIHLDYQLYYKKFELSPRTSYSLDNIVGVELKQNKIAYDGDLGELYRNDPKKFFDYALHDVRLLKNLDEKKKFMDLIRALGRQATCKYDELLGSIKYLELSIRNYCQYQREQTIILPDLDLTNVRENFVGGYVLDTKVGSYGYTSSIDLASLYPSTIRSVNISPETHVFQCMKNDEDFVRVVERSEDVVMVLDRATGEYISIVARDLHDFVRENDLTISAYGSIFHNDHIGLIPEILELWYAERKSTKKLGLECARAGDKIKAEYYDLMQKLKKVGLNSLYGAISNPYSRFYSIALAASITTTAQAIEKFQIWKADQVVEDMYVNSNI